MSTGLAPFEEYLGGQTIGWTSRSTPIAFSVPGWTNGLLVSICACLAHMYMEKQGWTHFTLFISFLLCCFKLRNHLHTINCDIWLLRTTTPLFFTGSSVSCSCSRSSPWSKPFCSCKHLAREVDDPGARGRDFYIGNTDSLIRASEHKQGL